MYVQIITFRLDGMSPDEFSALSDHVATQYGDVPGLISKIFLADPDDVLASGRLPLGRPVRTPTTTSGMGSPRLS